jgi:hypothetical protein
MKEVIIIKFDEQKRAIQSRIQSSKPTCKETRTYQTNEFDSLTRNYTHKKDERRTTIIQRLGNLRNLAGNAKRTRLSKS